MPADRDRLRALIDKLCISEGDFVLSTGAKSRYYFDCKAVALDGEGLALIAQAFLEEAGNEIVGILAVVDREQGGKKTLEEKYKHVRTLFKTSDFPRLASLAQKGGARALV